MKIRSNQITLSNILLLAYTFASFTSPIFVIFGIPYLAFSLLKGRTYKHTLPVLATFLISVDSHLYSEYSVPGLNYLRYILLFSLLLIILRRCSFQLALYPTVIALTILVRSFLAFAFDKNISFSEFQSQLLSFLLIYTFCSANIEDTRNDKANTLQEQNSANLFGIYISSISYTVALITQAFTNSELLSGVYTTVGAFRFLVLFPYVFSNLFIPLRYRVFMLLISLSGAIVSQSRTILLGLFIFILAQILMSTLKIMAYSLKKPLQLNLRILLVIGATFSLLVTMLSVTATELPFKSLSIFYFVSTNFAKYNYLAFEPLMQVLDPVRLYQHKYVLSGGLTNILLGHGLGAGYNILELTTSLPFSKLIAGYSITDLNANISYSFHDSWTQYVYTAGLPGLLLFIWPVVKNLMRTHKLHGHTDYVFAVGLLIILLNSWFNIATLTVGLYFCTASPNHHESSRCSGSLT